MLTNILSIENALLSLSFSYGGVEKLTDRQAVEMITQINSLIAHRDRIHPLDRTSMMADISMMAYDYSLWMLEDNPHFGAAGLHSRFEEISHQFDQLELATGAVRKGSKSS